MKNKKTKKKYTTITIPVTIAFSQTKKTLNKATKPTRKVLKPLRKKFK